MTSAADSVPPSWQSVKRRKLAPKESDRQLEFRSKTQQSKDCQALIAVIYPEEPGLALLTETFLPETESK
jgi:hypothetical protein